MATQLHGGSVMTAARLRRRPSCSAVRKGPARIALKHDPARQLWQGLTAPGRCTTLAPGTWFRSGAEKARLPITGAGGMAMQWRHRTAVVNGIHIHYVTHGQGAPVILLHGWPEFWYSCQFFAP